MDNELLNRYANLLINLCIDETKYLNIDKMRIDIILELKLMKDVFNEKYNNNDYDIYDFAHDFVSDFSEILIINKCNNNDNYNLETRISETLSEFLME